jgi:hypothetical protein
MHQNPDDLTALERQLAACQPAATGLDTDAMLFAAGQGAARRPQIIWPTIAFGLTILSAALGAGMIHERSERLALAVRLDRQSTIVAETPAAPVAPLPPPGPNSYLAIHQSMAHDADGWLARSDHEFGPTSIPSEKPSILHAWPGISADLP